MVITSRSQQDTRLNTDQSELENKLKALGEVNRQILGELNLQLKNVEELKADLEVKEKEHKYLRNIIKEN